jgi:hypothetical protein
VVEPCPSVVEPAEPLGEATPDAVAAPAPVVEAEAAHLPTLLVSLARRPEARQKEGEVDGGVVHLGTLPVDQ